MWEHGTNPSFREFAETIINRRCADAQANYDELTRLRDMAPEDYIGDFGETAIEGHASATNVREMWHRQYAANGFGVGPAL